MFFIFLFLIIILFIILIIFTTIQVHIQNVKLSTDKINGRRINKDYKIVIKLNFFDKINYLTLNITKRKMEKKDIGKSIEKFKKKSIKNNNDFDLKSLMILKKLKIQIEKINLIIKLGLKDASVTAISVGGMSGILGAIFRTIIKEPQNALWNVEPIYQNRNVLNIELNCIFDIKMIHIIYTIYNERRSLWQNIL